jgi:proline iminopeptidase
MKKLLPLIILSSFFLQFCTNYNSKIKDGSQIPLSQYFDTNGRNDISWGGIKMITINTPKGDFNVWTKRTGNNPKIKVLLLHGGPGSTHEYFQCFDSYFPGEGFEYYYYDQLGSYYSDQPDDTSLWKIDRFVEEVEQVRKALKLDSTNFYLLGKSWGGTLAIEYALKYQQNLKGLIISNMTSSTKAYNDYVNNVLAPQMDPKALSEIREMEKNKDFSNPKYMGLLLTEFYTKFIYRQPVNKWPVYIFKYMEHSNNKIYNLLQGPSEFGVTGTLLNWNRENDLKQIYVPTLTIGAKYDEMDPDHLKWMSSQVKNGRFLFCPNGSHYAMYDDQKIYFEGLIKFIKDVDKGHVEKK